MDEAIYDRQSIMRRPRSIPSSVHIIGCGGVGSWVALYLALAGVEDLELYDGDTVQPANLNRLPYPLAKVGTPKTQALEDLLLTLRPEIELHLHGEYNHLLHNFQEGQYIVCAVDTLKARQYIHEKATEAGAIYIDVGAEEDEFTISDSPADWEQPGGRQGYFTPIYVAPVTMAAGMVTALILNGLLPPVGIPMHMDLGRLLAGIQAPAGPLGPYDELPRAFTPIVGLQEAGTATIGGVDPVRTTELPGTIMQDIDRLTRDYYDRHGGTTAPEHYPTDEPPEEEATDEQEEPTEE